MVTIPYLLISRAASELSSAAVEVVGSTVVLRDGTITVEPAMPDGRYSIRFQASFPHGRKATICVTAIVTKWEVQTPMTVTVRNEDTGEEGTAMYVDRDSRSRARATLRQITDDL